MTPYVLPAYAGMIRPCESSCPDSPRAPRVCGDDPRWVATFLQVGTVLPAYAGMIPIGIQATEMEFCAPRVCGDDPSRESISRRG